MINKTLITVISVVLIASISIGCGGTRHVVVYDSNGYNAQGYDELGYNKLINKHHRNTIKSLYNLIYFKCDFREKSVTMKFIKDAPDNLLINFMKRFNAEDEEVSIALIEEKF